MAAGVALLGRYQGSGTRDARYLVRSPDGTVLQVPELLYTVVGLLDGRRDNAAVAARASEELGRTVTPDDVAVLVEDRLLPAGLVDGPAAPAGPEPTRHTAVRGLRPRIVPPHVVELAATPLLPLFRPLVAAAVLASVAVLDVWLLTTGALGATLDAVAAAPAVLLAVAGLTIASGAFHELGHATACRYGGARPGRIGVGFFLVWPAFFSDLDDTYRLDRRGRLRADLGGVYFNAVFVLGLGIAYRLTGSEIFLLAAVVQHLLVAQQLLPFLRLDGYHVLSDLAGVPDLAARWRPVLRGLLVGRRARAAVADLRPSARLVVIAWVALTLPGLAAGMVVSAVRLPHGLAFASAVVQQHATGVADAWTAGAVAVAAGHVLHLAVLALPLLGLLALVGRLTTRLRRRTR